MKKIALYFLLLLALPFQKAKACGDPFDYHEIYFALFPQELTQTNDLSEFLLTYRDVYTPIMDDDSVHTRYNANIKEWSAFMKISNEQAYYLVMKASREAVDSLLNYHSCPDPKLKFANEKFCKSNHNALIYISYAKYLEPYMGNEFTSVWSYDYESSSSIYDLDYKRTLQTLIQLYNNQNDKFLKLRYGYQMVRLAHYTGYCKEAIAYFYKYVEPLKLKTEIYYYALCQKAGAARNYCLHDDGGECEEDVSNGDIEVFLKPANTNYTADFLTVFEKSHDMKFIAYTSLQSTGSLEGLFENASSLSVKNRISLYFLLGYQRFADPVNEMEKIVALDPNAETALVLMARYINGLERNIHEEEKLNDFTKCIASSRLSNENEQLKSCNRAIAIAERMVQQSKHKDFWRFAAATLNAFAENYDAATEQLRRVNNKDQMYVEAKAFLSLYIDIMKEDNMTKSVADSLYKVQKALFPNVGFFCHGDIGNYYLYRKSFFLIQRFWSAKFAEAGDTTTAFLVNNTNSMQQSANNIDLWNKIVDFKKQTVHNGFEKWLLKESGNLSLEELNQKRAMIHMFKGNFEDAYKLVSPNVYVKWKCAFCSNIRGFNYNDPEEKNDFQYDYIKELLGNVKLDSMPVKDYIGLLMKLDQLRKRKNSASPKAAFLLGNFYYNLREDEGYYRWSGCLGFCSYDLASSANHFYKSGLDMNPDKELKARLLFALAKNNNEGDSFYNSYTRSEPIFYYKELKKSNNTDYYKTIVSKCKYFELYVN
ncbi:MAG: hypothetical protein KBT32_00650 [Bacteroidales bacterium]|nr:hypothetical protein [Candidatus Physcocola equi]